MEIMTLLVVSTTILTAVFIIMLVFLMSPGKRKRMKKEMKMIKEQIDRD